jgi:asparagine synthase (glutamine-hydrolysing)
MCGIAGIVDRKGVDLTSLIGMSQVMLHRGPDDEGYYLQDLHSAGFHFRGNDTIQQIQAEHIDKAAKSEDKFLLGLLHRRLSIIDLTPGGHQPMSYDEDRLHIVYNGEIYNYREVREDLIKRGYEFKTDSDTEVILAAYHCWGKKCCEHFMGMWAFAICDSVKGALFLSRDRFGIKPLYYNSSSSYFVFASEIKAFFQDSNFSRKINNDNLGQYVLNGKISESGETLYEEVRELLPGHNLEVDLNTLHCKHEKYYDLHEKVQSIELPDNVNYLEEYESRFKDAIAMHMRADVKVGSCLSGGLDSSAIVRFASEIAGGNGLSVFTAAYYDHKIDESGYARKVCDQLKNVKSHLTWPAAEGYWNDLDKLIWHQDLPIASTSMFAQWEVMKLAHQHQLKVLLDGQGADETLGGYSIFAGIHMLGLFRKFQIGKALKEAKYLKTNRSINIWKETGRAAFQFLPQFLQEPVQQRERLGSKFLKDNFLVEIRKDRRVASGRTYYEMSLQSVKYGMQDLLRYEDRNSMAFSIESRVPFLDHRLVEFTLALPESEKIAEGWTKLILRKTIDKKLPQEVVWRKDKKGFVTPQRKWMEELKPQLTEFLHTARIPSIVNKDAVVTALNRSELNAAEVSEFWKMISLIKWFEKFSLAG